MYTLKKGWTKEKVLKQFKERNDGTRCVNDMETCKYLNDDGNVCAVGAFIPDKYYDFDFEEMPVEKVLVMSPKLKRHMPLSPKGMQAMQVAHDECHEDIVHNGDTYAAIEEFLDTHVKEYGE